MSCASEKLLTAEIAEKYRGGRRETNHHSPKIRRRTSSDVTSVTCRAYWLDLTFYCLPELRAEGCAINDAATFHANRAASARAFVHSLNILIKYARMYGPDHKR